MTSRPDDDAAHPWHQRARDWIGLTAPGLLLATGVAAVAVGVSQLLPPVFGPVLVAVVAGLLIGNTLTLPAGVKPGLGFASQKVLRLGVILLGARLSLGDVAAIGGTALWVVVICMAVAFLTVALLARLAKVGPRLAVLLGVGTAVCGNSAIMATAPIVEAEEREISFAVATITIFGTSALLIFPLLAHAVDLPAQAFGFWAGLSINDTSQVVAAGAAYSPAALDVAAVVKLVRNALMAPLIVIIAWWAAHTSGSRHTPDGRAVRYSALKAFPAFLLGFLALAVLRTLGVISVGLAEVLSELSTVSIAVAITAVGLGTKVSELRPIGMRALLVGLGAALALAVVGFTFSIWLGA